jgi:hypothetical protein
LALPVNAPFLNVGASTTSWIHLPLGLRVFILAFRAMGGIILGEGDIKNIFIIYFAIAILNELVSVCDCFRQSVEVLLTVIALLLV